jgi:uncharacterized protein (DUF1697 family)
MKTYTAFLRGINIGGIVLKMDEVKKIFSGLGLRKVRTYIQSGNVVFESDAADPAGMEKDIREAIRKHAKLDIDVLVKDRQQMQRILSEIPFGKNQDEKRIYFTLLDKKPLKEYCNVLDEINSDTEKFVLKTDVVYSLYGNGYGKSKFTNNFFEKAFKVSATTRNLNTMRKMAEMMDVE